MRAALGLAAAAAVVALAAPAARAQPLQTGVFDPLAADGARTYSEIGRSGAQVVRVLLDWRAVVPDKRPRIWDPEDPESAGYDWSSFDSELEKAKAAGLEPLVDILHAPAWATNAAPKDVGGPGMPDVAELRHFALAAARRYDGFGDVPRVRYWQVWNEPNLSRDLSPQLVGGKPVSPDVYRRMVNAVAASVKSVHADNLVVAGGTAPFYDNTPYVTKQMKDWGPLTFMRDLLCLSPDLKPTCKAKTRFDVWSTHPYTSGGPTHTAVFDDDVSLGDLPEMRKVLNAAKRAGHIRSRGAVRFWVTEFSWDSKKPDPHGVPNALLKRWVPQALYEMWRSGVSLVTWFLLRDQPYPKSPYQGGLYYRNGKPKPFLQGFRFPLVAFPSRGGTYVWGRTPTSSAGRVVLERKVGSRWRRLALVTADRNGIFHRRFAVAPNGWVRARFSGEQSLPFSLTPVPDQVFYPFGQQPLEDQG